MSKNDVMFIRVSYHYNHDHPIVEFQRVRSNICYELNTQLRAYRIQQLINRYSDDMNRFTQYVRINQLVISLAV